ncbi:MAG TPA: type II secretion system protein [Deltaproteobacteria bacterium]|jgi:general secretion pathway protein H|nr:type II secretion system protein [Deltaproteobacteria bacterium]HOI07474.1 type II secretion system protein [Deltaproteobacteria bacterium]
MREKLRSSRAFTLIELLVVIVILGITLGYVGPKLYTGFSTSSLDQAARDILTMVQYARSSAVTKHRPYYVRFDIEHAKFGLYPKPETSGEIELEKEKELPQGISFKGIKSPYQSEKRDGQADILVTPEGVVEQGVIYLDGGGGDIHTLVVKPFSGMLKTYDHFVEVIHEE